MLFKPELNNETDVLRWYDARENPCYVLCTGVKLDARQIMSKWVNDDNIAGKEKLLEALNFITNNSSNINVYTLVSFPYTEGIENEKLKDVEGETIRFQFHSSNYSSYTLGNTPTVISDNKSDYAKELLLMMKQQNAELLQRIQAIEDRRLLEEEEDDEDETKEPLTGKERLLGALAGIVERPEFTETIFVSPAPTQPTNENL
jgi:hypothetical protein